MSYVIGTIYRIYYKLDPTLEYIGSSYFEVMERWRRHCDSYKRYLSGIGDEIAIYPYFKELGIENFEIIKIKDYLVYREDGQDHKHLSAYEQLWINKLKPVNKVNAFNPLFKNKRYEKIRSAIRRANLTEEQHEKIKAKQRVENMTQEQIEAINGKRRNENLTEEQIEARNDKQRIANLTEEQHQKKKIRDAKYRANMTEKQKEAQLKSARKSDARPERRAKQLQNAKNRKKKCEICNIEIRSDSMPDHLRSKRHLKNLEEYNKKNLMVNVDVKII